MLLNLLLVLEIIVGVLLTVVVLMQRSEGGALGMGGGSSGFMTARGAGDLLTRITWTLGAIFFSLGLILTVVAGRTHGSSSVVDRLKVDSLDPSALSRPPPAPPTDPSAPAGPAPLQAPTPTVGNPFTGQAPASLTAPVPVAPPAN